MVEFRFVHQYHYIRTNAIHPITSVLKSSPVWFFCLFWCNRTETGLKNFTKLHNCNGNHTQPVAFFVWYISLCTKSNVFATSSHSHCIYLQHHHNCHPIYSPHTTITIHAPPTHSQVWNRLPFSLLTFSDCQSHHIQDDMMTGHHHHHSCMMIGLTTHPLSHIDHHHITLHTHMHGENEVSQSLFFCIYH